MRPQARRHPQAPMPTTARNVDAVKALVLSGGAGTRLRPITHTSAKQLVPVANKPILFFGLEALVAAGITEIGIIVGHTGDEIREAVGDGSAFGAAVTYIDQPDPLGLAHCVLIARDFLGDDSFVMYLGDNLLRQGVTDLVAGFAHRPAEVHAQILLARVPDPERFGVAEVEGGRVVRLVEKPVVPPSDLALVGVYLFDPRIHDAVRAIEPSPRGELEITDAIQWLLDRGEGVTHQNVDGWWIDTGNVEALLEGNRLILETLEPRNDGSVDEGSRIEGRVVVEAGAQLVRSLVRGPAIVGAGTVLTDSYVGPFSSIAAGCTITDSEVEHSVVLTGATISGLRRITDSLIGQHTVIGRSTSGPTGTRLVVGDHARVELA